MKRGREMPTGDEYRQQMAQELQRRRAEAQRRDREAQAQKDAAK